MELGLAVHDFIQRGNSFVNDTYKSNRRYTLHGSMIWPFSKNKISGGVKHSALYVEQGNLSTLQIGLAEMWIYPLHLGLFYRQQMTSLDDDFDKFEALYFIKLELNCKIYECWRKMEFFLPYLFYCLYFI